MAKATKDDRLPYGLSILIFGLIFLLSRVGLLAQIPYGTELLSIGAFFLITGIVFLLTSSNKRIGVIFTLIGLVMKSDLILNYSKLIVPILLIILGIILVLTSKR